MRRGAIPLLIAVALCLGARPAWASGAAAPTESMLLLLMVLAVIGAGYLIAHFVLARLQRRFLFVSGAEYLLLGVLLGSSSGVLSDTAALAPVIAFGTGWIGLLEGSRLRMAWLQGLPRWSSRIALVDAVVVGGGMTALALPLLAALLGVTHAVALLPAAVLGCAAASSSNTATQLLGTRYPHLASGTLDTLAQASRLTEALSILAFGLLLCFFHPAVQGASFTPVPAEWVLLMLGLGVTLGGLFSLLVSQESTENHRFMALVGIICFATGAAFFLGLSALAVNLVLGVVLAHSAKGQDLSATLSRTVAPVLMLLLLLAGVVWSPVPALQGVALAAVVVLGRVGLKLLSGWMASAGTPLRGDIGRGTLAQGPVALCIALSYRLIFEGEAVDLVFTAILASVVLNELLASRVLKGLLVDAGELRQDVALEGGSTGTGG